MLALLRLLLILLISTSSLAARAQDYEHVVQEGLEEFRAGNYEEARQLFLTAHGIQPNARTLRGLGATEFELRRYPEAVRYLEQALESSAKPLGGELRVGTFELLARARRFVGRVRLMVHPSNATLEIDGERSELTAELLLGVGSHELTFQADNRKPVSRTIEIIGGQIKSLTIELPPLVGDVAANGQGEPRTDDDRARKRKRRWIWTSVSIAVAAGIATTLALTMRPEPRARKDEGDLGISLALGERR